jgi:phage shock protein A
MVQPTSGAGAGPPLDNLKAQVQQQWSALDQQQQQFAGMRASLEASHKRQLETERRQRETTQQQCELWKGKTEELVRQLTDARAQVAALQQQQALSDRRSTGSASASGSSGGGAAGDRQQQRQRLLQESVVRELQGQLSQARQEKADLQAQLDQATSENAVHKAEIKKQVGATGPSATYYASCVLLLHST